MIMEEIEPTYFRPFPYTVIPKNAPKDVLDKSALKKVYKYMLSQMHVWFQEKSDERNDN